MPTATAYATAVASTVGTWTNPNNALGANDGAVATISPARNVWAYIELQLDPTVLGSSIPAGSTLVGAPSRSLWIGSSSNSQVSATRQWFVNDVAITTEDPATVTIGVTEEVADAPLTIDHLRSSKVTLRIGVVRTGTQARTFSLDALRLTFEYNPPEVAAAWDGATWQTAEVWNGTRWVVPEVWNGIRWIPLGSA